MELYRDLCEKLYGDDVIPRMETEQNCFEYYSEVKKNKDKTR
jgi:hypothetical protein